MPRAQATTPRGDLLRARIQAAALELFAGAGFHGVSVRDIARTVEMPAASLLHYFPTKSALYASVLASVAGEIDGITDVVGDDARPHRDRLAALVDGLVDFAQGDPGKVHLLNRELLDNAGRLEHARQLPLGGFVGRVAAFVRDGTAAGVFHSVDPTLFLIQLVGTTTYFTAVGPTFRRLGALGDDEAAAWQRFRFFMLATAERTLVRPTAPGKPDA